MDGDGVVARGRAVVWVLALALLSGLLPGGVVAAASEVYSYRDRSGVLHFTNAPADVRFRPTRFSRSSVERVLWTPRRGRALPQHTSARSRRAPLGIEDLLDRAARRHGVDRALVHAVARAESNFDPWAVSSAGALGVMQLMPGTAAELGVADPFRVEQNIEGGVNYLSRMLERFSGDVRRAVAAYNAGPGAVERHGDVPPFAETRAYVDQVFLFRQEFLRGQLAARVAGG